MVAEKEKLGFAMVLAVVVGNMMSSGIALLPSYLAAVGSITIISWILTALGALALGYIFSELGLRDAQTGGIVAYAHEINALIGFQSAVLYIYSNWVGNVGIVVTGVTYLSLLFPILNSPLYSAFFAILLIWMFVLINARGANWMGTVAMIGIIILFIPVIATISYGWHFFDKALFLQNWNVSNTHSFAAVASGVTICLWSFAGLESASTNAHLLKNPERDIPLTTMAGVVISAIVYIITSSVLLGIFSAKNLAESNAPFSMAAGQFFGEWSAPVIALATAFACFASMGSWMMMVGQASLRAGKDRVFPKVFTEVNKHDIPIKGLSIQATAMTIILLIIALSSSNQIEVFNHAISISVLLIVFPYFYVILNYVQKPDDKRHPIFKAIICAFAAFFCFSAFIGATKSTLEAAIIFFLIVFLFYRRGQPLSRSRLGA